jgi:hypothetical protein
VPPVAGASLMNFLCQSAAAALTMFLVCSHCFMASGHQFDLPFSAELWDEKDTHVEELIALIGDYGVLRAAYEEAIRRRPGRIVTLRQKTRVLADSRRKA